jgi:hypothetical protein
MKSGMPASRRPALVVLLLVAIAALVLGLALSASGREQERRSRAGGLRFAPEMAEADRAWVRAAIASARPEARRLIDEIDGIVQIEPQAMMPEAIGQAVRTGDAATIMLDTAALNSDRALDRNVVVLHELGHVIDFELVSDDLVRQLDAGIPRGTCRSVVEHVGACTVVEERFADTFAKWALGGAVSLAGSGYGVPAPASLEDWGAPLGRLAAELTVRDAR